MHLELGILVAIGCGVLLIGVGLGSLPAFSFKKRVRYMDHIVEIRNTILGWETIVLDGQILVSKFTFLKPHHFMIGADRAEVSLRYRWHLMGVRVRFVVNDHICYED